MENLIKIHNFLEVVGNLKNIYRWCKTRDGREESTAEHSWKMALMAIIYHKELGLNLDLERVLKMVIIHDLAEAITGDIDAWDTHKDPNLKAMKDKNEIEAMKEMTSDLPDNIRDEILSIWLEYEERVTNEAKFVKAIDKLEALTQIIEMGNGYYSDQPLDFIATFCDKAISEFPALKGVYFSLKQKLKKEYVKGGFYWKDEYDAVKEQH